MVCFSELYMDLPYLVFSDEKGNICHHPFLRMVSQSLDEYIIPEKKELITLPKGSSIFYLPQRLPVGFNPYTGEIEILEKFQGKDVFAVGAFPIPAFLRLYTPAYVIKKKIVLPLWAYTSCGFHKGKFCITGVRVDKRVRQSPRFYDNDKIKIQAKEIIEKYPDNRLYRHLANCALNYNCLAAKNLFLNRWEAPLPTARYCNARCIGCISYKDSDCVSSHQRINFKPRVNELVEVMVNHLKAAREAIVSFGQGCEGEPLLESEVIAQSIREVRRITNRGTINMNTNGSLPLSVEKLCKSGMDSFRISLNSTEEKFYNIYFNPKGYKFQDVLKSIEIAKKYKKFVSINLFVFPGFTDSSRQIGSLAKFIREYGVDMIQWRNLNIDPAFYLKKISYKKYDSKGLLFLINTMKQEFPALKMGYFNITKDSF